MDKLQHVSKEEAMSAQVDQTDAVNVAEKDEGVKDVDMYEAMAEDDKNAPASAKDAPEKKDEDIVDILRPKAEPKVWTIGKENYAREYTQRPLSFIKKMQWFSLVGEVLDKALSGDNAMSLNSLFSTPERNRSMTVQDILEADTFVQAVGKLLSYAPDFLTKSYCIWLSVPDFEQDVAIKIMEMSPEDGGLTDQQGIEMIEVFIDQNYEALDRFFREDIGQLRKRIEARQEDAKVRRPLPR